MAFHIMAVHTFEKAYNFEKSTYTLYFKKTLAQFGNRASDVCQT